MFMKKFNAFLIICLVTGLVISCNNDKKAEVKKEKPAENLQELIKKFDGKEFKDCDEFLAAGDEMIDVYIKTVNKAYDGDEKAKEDLQEFDQLMNKFDSQAEKFSVDCPEKFEKWAEATDKRVAEVTDKLLVIFYDEYEGVEWDEEEIQKELDKQLEDLNQDLKKVQEEEGAAS